MGVLDGKKIAVLFPGQGSQSVGMGQDLVRNFPKAAKMYAEADQILGFNFSKLCWEGPEEDIMQTVNTQPALFVASAVAYEIAVEKGLVAAFSAGHSVGEYAALYAAGAFSFAEGLRLVRRRAKLMDKAARASGGAMAAILGLTPDKIEEAVASASDAGIVVAANINSPVQTVISGELAAVQKAGEQAKQLGAKRVVPLKVSGAFHSPLMQSAADEMRRVLQDSPIVDSRIEVAANFTGELQKSARQIRQNLARQVVGTVRWIGCVESLVGAGVDTFVELGPGNVLAGLVKRIAPQAGVHSAGDSASLAALLD